MANEASAAVRSAATVARLATGHTSRLWDRGGLERALWHPDKTPGRGSRLASLARHGAGTALLAAIAAVWIFAFLTSRGDLPIGFGNLTYPPGVSREHELELRVAELGEVLDERLTLLEQGKATADEALPILTRELLDLRERLQAIERQRGG
jgi:hypothetical protein